MEPLVAFLSSQEAAVFEHVLGVGIECPVVSLACVARFARHFDEAVVQ